MSSIKVRKYQDSVYIIYCHKNKKFKIFTGVKIEDKFWNLCAPKKNCPDYANVINQIAAMETRVLNASMAVRAKGIEPSVELVKEEFYKQLTPRQCKQPFWEKYKEYLELLTCRESTKRQIAMTYKVLEHYCTWSEYRFDIDTWDHQLTHFPGLSKTSQIQGIQAKTRAASYPAICKT